MGELKGQILGLILVITLFGTLATAITAIFTKATDGVSSKLDEQLTKKEAIKEEIQLTQTHLRY